MDRAEFSSSQSREFEIAASQAVHRIVKSRTRALAHQPQALNALHPGLAVASPSTLIAIASYLEDQERRLPRRALGFGNEISLINIRAALLLGRASR